MSCFDPAMLLQHGQTDVPTTKVDSRHPKHAAQPQKTELGLIQPVDLDVSSLIFSLLSASRFPRTEL